MFSRGSPGRHARDDRSRRGRPEPGEPLDERAGGAGRDDDAGQPAGAPAGAYDGSAETLAGPYDSSEAPPGGRQLDLGSLRIPSVPGVEVRVQANQEGTVQQVYLLHGDSALQLGVFAAPRSESIWDEVRTEIRQSLFSDGVAAEEVAGEYGTELRARVRTKQGLKDLRFVGVSGPRWLVRAVYQGPAAVDPASAGPLTECLRGLVVDRGTEARPVKEPLPLRLSEEMAAQLQSRAAVATGETSATGAGTAPSGTTPSGGAQVDGGAVDGRAVDGRAADGRAADRGAADGGAVDGHGADGGGPPPGRRPSPRPRRR